MKNGPMNTALASVTRIPARSPSAAPACPPIPNRIRKASAFLRKLSLKAEKNWHQNSGANRRAVIRERNMAVSRFRP